MKKRTIVSIASAGALVLVAIGSTSTPKPSNLSTVQTTTNASVTKTRSDKAEPICDGSTVTTDCAVDGVNYSTYIYHPGVPEKSHTETVTAYQQQVTGYCTLCNDGTYSPSCATGRGACSWHGGVAEWNAPRYTNVPVYSTKTVVDAPAQDAYYEKVPE